MAASNATLFKFGYPDTCIREFEHWIILLRPAQITLGSLVVSTKSEIMQFSHIPAEAFSELKLVTDILERSLIRAVQAEKFNYLMLMMVDPHVHFHVIPRYEGARQIGEVSIEDQDWPEAPRISRSRQLNPIEVEKIVSFFKGVFNQPLLVNRIHKSGEM